ncbi:MAG: hypothetical protein ACI8PP_000418 [Candidatus Pseudothioglobus sp.]|jgi:hypothetical protein
MRAAIANGNEAPGLYRETDSVKNKKISASAIEA